MSEPIKQEICTCSNVGEMFFDPDDDSSPDRCMKCGKIVKGVKQIEPARTELMLRKKG